MNSLLARRCWFILPLLTLGLIGCGDSSGRVPVSGTVTLDGQPLADALVTFFPGQGTGELGGHGKTGPDGKYTLTPARPGSGLLPGAYTVVISRPLRPDGSPPPPNVPPIESDARETLPEIYSSRKASTLSAKVAKETISYDFALRLPGKS